MPRAEATKATSSSSATRCPNWSPATPSEGSSVPARSQAPEWSLTKTAARPTPSLKSPGYPGIPTNAVPASRAIAAPKSRVAGGCPRTGCVSSAVPPMPCVGSSTGNCDCANASNGVVASITTRTSVPKVVELDILSSPSPPGVLGPCQDNGGGQETFRRSFHATAPDEVAVSPSASENRNPKITKATRRLGEGDSPPRSERKARSAPPAIGSRRAKVLHPICGCIAPLNRNHPGEKRYGQQVR